MISKYVMIFSGLFAIGWIFWSAQYAHKCVDLNYPACVNSSGWLETFEVLSIVGIVPALVVFFGALLFSK